MHKFWSSFLKYDSQKYWEKRGKNFFSEKIYDNSKYREQEKKLLNHLSTFDFSSVLEIGCGFGRITRLILDNFKVDDYLGFDISPDLINIAIKLKKDYPNTQFKVGDIIELKLEKKYDLIIGSEILMHIPPKKISHVINNLINFSNKHIVNVDWYQKPKPRIRAGHNFVHNYEQIYKMNPSIIRVSQIPIANMIPPSVIFHAEVDST